MMTSDREATVDEKEVQHMKELIERINAVEIADASLFSVLGAWAKSWRDEATRCLDRMVTWK